MRMNICAFPSARSTSRTLQLLRSAHSTRRRSPTVAPLSQITCSSILYAAAAAAAAMSTSKRNIDATLTSAGAGEASSSEAQQVRASKRQAVSPIRGAEENGAAKGTALAEAEDAAELDEEAMIAAAMEAEHQDAKDRSDLTPAKTEPSSSSSSSSSAAKASTAAPLSSDLTLAIGNDALEVERRTMHAEWFRRLEKDMRAPSFEKLKAFLASEAKSGKVIYPPPDLIHSWSRLTPPSKVKVVIIGQDPYHGPGQACGMSFSVPKGVPVPPSLKNIYKELRAQYGAGFAVPTHGCLDGWAKQGVLLLNACLTVRAHAAASHHGQGWEPFTRQVIKSIAADAARSIGKSPDAKVTPSSSAGSGSSSSAPSKGNSTITSFFGKPKNAKAPSSSPGSKSEEKTSSSAQGGGTGSGVVFLAWGAPAAKTLAEAGVTSSSPNVLVLKSAHPSPLSAHKGFFRAAAAPRVGDSLFEEANRWLTVPARRGPNGGIRWADL
ncbi:uracil-DNA glycosylase [Ceraceosorus guamensis]|uniref:Uracil-DNA glycosylase n=1 Tax=Ceraceosorus guamensis TaxID=1522189 RepID=A0A316VR87_9BASI|nr:uracil-DNA glycosylase [Ceraceosorus guamensis]PWN38691.1 uracil-DNA glycosylase [Ceraceosorus guamensis]